MESLTRANAALTKKVDELTTHLKASKSKVAGLTVPEIPF